MAYSTKLPVQWQRKPTVMFFLTTGEDKKVNVWAIGKPTAVLVGFNLALDYHARATLTQT